MKIKKLFLLALCVIFITGIFFAGCRRDTMASTGGFGPDLLLLPTIQNMGDRFPGAWDNPGMLLRSVLFSRLLKLDSDLEPVYGDLAESWTVSPDGMTYTFTLKNNIKWHDGVPFTADDVVFSIKTAMKSPQVNGVIKSAVNCIRGAIDFTADNSRTAADAIEGISVSGNTITITMDQASGTFLLAMAQFNILPRHKLEGLNPLQLNSSAFYDWPIGTGPYKVIEFIPNDYALLEFFDDYFGPRHQIRQIKLTQMTENDYPTRALADDIDYFQTNSPDIANAAIRNPNYRAFYTDIYFIRYLQWNSHGINSENDPLNDIRIRRAIVHAIDLQAIIDSLLPGQATLINSKVPVSFDYSNRDVYDLGYNPERARQLLNEAGFDFSRTLRLSCYFGDQGSRDFMDALVYYLGAVGIRSEWYLMTGDLVPQLYENPEYHLVLAGLSAMAPEEAYNIFHSNTINTSLWGNIFPTNYRGLDRLLEELWVTVDAGRRRQLLMEIQRVETEEMLWHIPLYSLRNIQVFNTTRVTLPPELVLSNEWTNYERHLDKWTLNPAR